MSALTPSATPTAPGGPTSGLAPAAPSAAARTARRYASFAARRTGQALIVVVLSYVLVFAVLAASFGFRMDSEINLIVALTIYGVAIMVRSVTDGLESADPSARAAAVAVGYGPWRRFWAVEFPLAGPVMLAGLRVTATSTISLATVGILIGIQNLGYLFTNGGQRRIIPEVLAGVVAVVVIAIIVDLVLALAGRLLMPWLPTRAATRRERRAARSAKAAIA